MLDTSYMLPVFGVDVGIDSAASIQATLSRLVAKGTELYISDLSPFEAFIKSYRIAEKIRDERGKEEAKLGLLFVAKGGWATRIDHNDDEIIEEAFKVRLKHNDPFDCFIFATAKVRNIPLVTEDDSAPDFIGNGLVMTWAVLKKSLRA
ncbi:PIN domain-containing protein [Candidatus Bathyarchaeota archaeon]|jgi:PIN domain nuclease of toxin-antitoxin system|nr:MAG: PIN domain-containing protein [Candidatus Bathyarchaeota archaeon]